MSKRKAVAIALLGYFILSDEETEIKKRKCWVKPWLKQKQLGCYDNLLREFLLEDSENYRRWLRLDESSFKEILEIIRLDISKQDTILREAISAEQRLAVTLRFIATGESFQSLGYQFRISKNLISQIIPEVCRSIYNGLRKKYLPTPSTEIEWKTIANEFENRWNFPCCIGALDGKHVVIQKPPSGGSFFINYKSTHSVVLMALVDADYKFIYVDVGTNGRISDSGVWAKCDLKDAIEKEKLNIPKPEILPGMKEPVPYVIVADGGFGMKEYMLRPYLAKNITKENQIFNYRLSRARRISENAFGILTHRFEIYRSPIRLQKVESIISVVLATVVLHNYLRSKISTRSAYSPASLIDQEDPVSGEITEGEWRKYGQESLSLKNLTKTGLNYSTEAKHVRELFKQYFNSTGAVSWQENRF